MIVLKKGGTFYESGTWQFETGKKGLQDAEAALDDFFEREMELPPGSFRISE